MVLIKIDRIKLKENFDALYRNRNEIYFRTVAWINDDYSTAQFYPPKEFHKDDNPYSAPVVKIKKGDELPVDTVVPKSSISNMGVYILLLNEKIIKIKIKFDNKTSIYDFIQNIKKGDKINYTDKYLSYFFFGCRNITQLYQLFVTIVIRYRKNHQFQVIYQNPETKPLEFELFNTKEIRKSIEATLNKFESMQNDEFKISELHNKKTWRVKKIKKEDREHFIQLMNNSKKKIRVF